MTAQGTSGTVDVTDNEELQVFYNVSVSCKGQLLRGRNPVKLRRVINCGFSRGTCASYSDASRVTKHRYCIADGTCVPHAPDESLPGGPLDIIVVLTQPQWGAYYHFVIESLSRLAWVYKHRPDLMQSNNTFFHTGIVSEIGQAWARSVGINTWTGPDNRLLDGWWHTKMALFPLQNACVRGNRDKPIGGPNAHAISWMRSRIHAIIPTMVDQSKVFSLSSAPDLALLVIRDNRWGEFHRAISNQDEVTTVVRQALKSWKLVEFTDWPRPPTFSYTCSLFYHADLIIGPHGAGFANLVCARSGVPLVEFRKAAGSLDYVALANILQLPYFGFPSGLADGYQGYVNPADVHRATLNATMHVKKTKRARQDQTKAESGRVAMSLASQSPHSDMLPLGMLPLGLIRTTGTVQLWGISGLSCMVALALLLKRFHMNW